MLGLHLPEIDVNNLQLEVFRKQTLNLSTPYLNSWPTGCRLETNESWCNNWLQNYLPVQCSNLLSVKSSVQIIAIIYVSEMSFVWFLIVPRQFLILKSLF